MKSWIRLAPALVLLAGVLLTAVAFDASKSAAETRYDAQYQAEVDKIASAIDQRFEANTQVLRGGMGLWNVEGDVHREDWATYVGSLELPSHFPGIQGVGYSVFVAPDEREAHEAAFRNQTPPPGPLLRPDLFSNYTIHDVTGARHEADVYTSIIYLEPFDLRNQNAIGLDMYSHPERRKAMDAAIETGRPVLSGKVTLVQEIEGEVQAGFLLYLPHYREGAPTATVEERRAAIEGFVYSPLRAGDLMRGVLGEGTQSLTFRIFDGTTTDKDALLFDNAGGAGSRVETRQMQIAGRTWTVEYANIDSFQVQSNESALVGVGGLSITGLMFFVVLIQQRTQRRAEEIADARTKELRASEQDKTRLAEDLARSNADLEQFAYIASHDLQEPTRTVESFIDLLDEDYADRLDDAGRGYIASARAGARRMRNLIQDLLEYSRAGQGLPVEGGADARTILDEALEESAAALEEAEAKLDVGALPKVSIRSTDLKRIFVNLLGNAVKYRDSERPLEISVACTVDGRMATFSFSDTGIGVDPADRDKLFVMFGRLHHRDQYPGTGMGLAICKRIIESRGGRIWMEGSAGTGTTFKWTLPTEPS